MAANSIAPVFPTFTDTAGVPLENGQIFIGQPGFEARSSPKASFFDIALTIPTGTETGAAVRTLAGFPARNGSGTQVYVDGDFSITVLDKNGVMVYTALNRSFAYGTESGANLPILATDGNFAATGFGFNNEANTGFVRGGAGILQTVVQGTLVSQQTAAGTVFQQPVSGAGFASGVNAIAQPIDADLTALATPTYLRGDIITRGVAALGRLALGAAGSVLTSDGTDAVWAVPALRCWGNMDATQVAGTYSRTGTLVTVTLTAHGAISGNLMYLDFTTGSATDGSYVITVVDANTFTVVDSASGATSGAVTRGLWLRAFFRVSAIVRTAIGTFTITMQDTMPDTAYEVNVSRSIGTLTNGTPSYVHYGTKTTTSFVFLSGQRDAGASSGSDAADLSFSILR